MNELITLTPYILHPNRVKKIDNPTYISSNGFELSCFQDEEKKEAKTLIIFHGNAETAKDYLRHYVPMFRHFHLNVFVVEYRGFGDSTGTANIINVLTDAINIFKALNKKAEDIIIFGRSFGSIPALHLASTIKSVDLIIENGIYDIYGWLEELTYQELMKGKSSIVDFDKLEIEVNTYLNSEQKLTNFKGNLLILHSGNQTEFIPLTHAMQFKKNAVNAKDVSYKILERGLHNDAITMNKQDYYSTVKQFMSSINVPEVSNFNP